jgi:VWFA-related protein
MTQRSLRCTLLAAPLLAAAISAQTPAPVSTPAAPRSAAVPTLRTSSRIVVVDVVVTDPKTGQPIRGLKQSDFTLLEKGQPQTLAHFEEHSSNPAAPSRFAPMPHLDPGVFTNYSPAPVDGALNVLLLDSLNTPMQDQAFVRDQMLKYLKTARPGTRMAIFGLNQRLHLLQGFTSDPDLLRKVVEGKKGLAQASPLMDDPVAGDTVGQESVSDQMAGMLGNSPGAAAVLANMQQFEAQQAAFQLTLRTEYTLDALNQLGRYLSGLSGRKNLIWFSGSFPLDILPDGDLQDPFAVVASFEDLFRETTNILARGQVAVYPIDARGLMVNPVFSASNSGSKYARSPSAFGKDQTKFFNQTASEHSTMLMMAEQTGGKAAINTNGLKEAVDQAVQNGANYYTLTYTPTNKDWRGDYRKIEVKLEEHGFALSYRRGYFADDPDKKPGKSAEATPATAATAFNPMRAAMLWGGPDPTQVIFTASVLPATGQPEEALAPGVRAEAKAAGPYKLYMVGYSGRGRDLEAPTTADGLHHLRVEFVIFVYNSEGSLVTSIGNQINADLTDANYQSVLKGGVSYRQQISVPVKGEYFLRIGMHDLNGDRVGALELPVSSVAGLKPYSVLQAEHAPAPTGSPTKP